MSSHDIDDSLYSRQRYVLGDSAMHKMACSNVLLHGIGGLGVEIAKNMVLAGIKSMTLQDSHTCSCTDLGTQFFIREDDIKENKNRAEASLSRIAELNPYVTVKTLTSSLDLDTDLSYMQEYNCVILTEASLEVQLKVDEFCRSQSPPIRFITADVYGVFSSMFCDFGENFEVVDTDGEEPQETFISQITKENPGVVSCLENARHGLETGDFVTFREVTGMTVLNGKQWQIKVLSPFTFSIVDTTGDEYNEYLGGGIMKKVKQPKVINFESLEKQLDSPSMVTPDLSKLEAPQNIHVSLYSLHKFISKHGRLPSVRCQSDADELIIIADTLNNSLRYKAEPLDVNMVKQLAFTAQGQLSPLCAALGGMVAQEALKALTGKFTPLQQWFHLDACEVLVNLKDTEPVNFKPRNDRYDDLRVCVGEDTCKKLADLKIFMVGCGAIGCEMLKNYALLGVGSSENGKITITDNDLIEKSNLNRQFLFRPHHIQKPKSTTAADSTREINQELNILAQQHKVCPQTEQTKYNDDFFQSQDICVNALDNLEARRYMDSRCVTNQKPLLESGTMGTKGHVQVIVPHLTESYATKMDPPDQDVPYCTLKSFPSNIEHCIQWSRDKFESIFSQKPALFNKFFSTTTAAEAVERLTEGETVDGAVQVSKTLTNRPNNYEDCIKLARLKFEKYFNHKAKNLLNAFPLDTQLQDGSPFWQSPKRPPTPVLFNPQDEIHMAFIVSASRLLAGISGLQYTQDDYSIENIQAVLEKTQVPDFIPSNKKIVADETVSKPEEDIGGVDDLLDSATRIKSVMTTGNNGVFRQMIPANFEKDDDENAHIDFIAASANLRGAMYNIESSDRLTIKRIAGRIVPAIATTTATVSGLVSIELIKLLQKGEIEQYKNCFLNMAIPVYVFSEPGEAEKVVVKEGLTFTLWDHWTVHGNKNFTLAEFIKHFKDTYGFDASAVLQGVKMVYVSIMPGHRKRLNQTMISLLKPSKGKVYTDLIVSLENEKLEDIPGPPIRYYFGL